MVLTQELYQAASNEYEYSLQEKHKRENGVFYTDVDLAEKIIKSLVKPKADSVILDPCCGTGSFLYAAEKNGYKNLHGIDCDENAINFCKSIISSKALYTLDFIGQASEDTFKALSLKQKVDYIIGNPPYVPITGSVVLNTPIKDHAFIKKVSESGKNLFVAAMIRSFDFLRSDGILSYIIPKNFLHVSSYSKLRREILKEKTIVSIVDIGAYFKNVRGEQIIITIRNTHPRKNSKIDIKKLSNNRFISMVKVNQSFYSDEILLFNTTKDFEVYKALMNYKKLGELQSGYVGRGKSDLPDAVSGKDIRKFGYKNISIPLEGNRVFIQNIYSAESGIIAAYGGNMNAGQTVTVFEDGDSKTCRYILGILHSRICNFFLYKYCYNYSRLTMHTDSKYLKKIPMPPHNTEYDRYFLEIVDIVETMERLEYMSTAWYENLEILNSVVYKAYSLEPEQVEYIDNETREFQSKRWIQVE